MNENSQKRLAVLADQGFVVFVDIRTDNPKVSHSNVSEYPEDSAVLNGNDDAILAWMRSEIGVIGLAKLRADAAADASLPDHRNGTLIARTLDGRKIGALLLHTVPVLPEAELNEAVGLLLLLAAETTGPEIAQLSARELAYLKKAANGDTDDEIAVDLSLSMRSVKERKKRTIADLGAENLHHAILLAKKSGQI